MAELVNKKEAIAIVNSIPCATLEEECTKSVVVGCIVRLPTTTEAEIRAKAIDEFAEKIIRYVDCGHLCNPTEIRWSDLSVVEMVKRLADELKEEQ